MSQEKLNKVINRRSTGEVKIAPCTKTRNVQLLNRKLMMNNKIKLFSIYLLIFLIFFFFLKFILQGKQLIENIKSISLIYLVPQIFLSLLSGIAVAYMNAIILKVFNIQLKFKEWFGLGCINTLSNFIFPMKTGTFLKAYYLKNKYDFAITHAFSIILFATFIKFQIDLLLTMIILGYAKIFLTFEGRHLNNLLFLSILLFLLLGISFLMLRRKSKLNIQTNNPILKRIIDKILLLMDSITLMGNDVRTIIMVVLFSVVTYVIQVLSFYFAFLSIGKPSYLLNMIFISLITSISELISITPSNLGIREVVISLFSTMINYTPEEGFLVAAVIRAVAIIVFSLLGFLSFIFLKNNLKRSVNTN